jgi:hypothetical protein
MPWGLARFHHSGQSHFVTFCSRGSEFAQGRLSTPQIIAFAMICSGRDDKVGKYEVPRSNQKRIEWAAR